MPDDLQFPSELFINAWTGDPAENHGAVGKAAKRWAFGLKPPEQFLSAAELPDETNWKDPRVGWGLVLPDDDALPDADKALGTDAPEPLRELLRQRDNAPVLRYRPQTPHMLRRYYVDQHAQDLDVATAHGTAAGCVPSYLLFYGGPDKIPWKVQYQWNLNHFVGRLHLEGEALENYVSCLLTDWSGSALSTNERLVWAVDHGANDITHLMANVIAAPVATALKSDNQCGNTTRHISGHATAADLIDALTTKSPAFILSTSHGRTGPLSNVSQMAADMGCCVDSNGQNVTPQALEAWQPDGAIWFCHACCSAGSDSRSQYEEMFAPGDQLRNTLTGVAAAGAMVAPVPTALLGAKRPLRAFIGQVEPTFDWTLRHPKTNQVTSTQITAALYNRMHQPKPQPVGLAFKDFFNEVGPLLNVVLFYRSRFDRGEFEFDRIALAAALSAYDRRSTVILGDPTVALPPLS